MYLPLTLIRNATCPYDFCTTLRYLPVTLLPFRNFQSTYSLPHCSVAPAVCRLTFVTGYPPSLVPCPHCSGCVDRRPPSVPKSGSSPSSRTTAAAGTEAAKSRGISEQKKKHPSLQPTVFRPPSLPPAPQPPRRQLRFAQRNLTFCDNTLNPGHLPT